jgi:hypothetical protein
MVLRRSKSRLPSALESLRSRSRFRWRNAPKELTRNTAAKKRAGEEDVDSDYLFAKFLQHLA